MPRALHHAWMVQRSEAHCDTIGGPYGILLDDRIDRCDSPCRGHRARGDFLSSRLPRCDPSVDKWLEEESAGE